MANIVLSPNMSLPVPVVGQESGPQFATDINSSLGILDQHNHTAGSGVQIPTSGLNINADLSANSNNLTDLRSSRYTSQVSPLALAADIQCIYVSGVDLYYNDSNGNQVRITQSGAVAGTPGSIANLASPASASYNSGNSTFVFQSGANTPGNLDGASVVLRNLTANSKGLTLSPPNAMAADYTVVLPALPSVQSFMTIDGSGNIGAPIAFNGGITNTNIAAGTITSANIGAGVVTGANIANATITSGNIAAAGIARSNLPVVGAFLSNGTTQNVTAGSYTAISNFIVNKSFNGSPVCVGIIPAVGVSNTMIQVSDSGGGTVIAFVGIFVDGVLYNQIRLGTSSGSVDFPPGVINTIIPGSTLTAGAHTVDIRALVASGTAIGFTNCQMYVYELMGS